MPGEQVVFALLRRFCPPPPPPPDEEPLTAAERRAYGGWMALFGLLAIPVVGGMAGLWFLCLRNAAQPFYPSPPGTVRLVRGSDLVWWLPALPLSIVTASIPLEWLVRLFLGARAARLRKFDREHAGFDTGRVFRGMTVLFFAGAAIYCMLAVRMFVRFDAAGMELGRPFRLMTRYYRDADIRAVEHRATLIAPIGTVTHRPHYMIVFADGTEWEVDGIYDLGPEGDRGLAGYIADRAGVPIVERP